MKAVLTLQFIQEVTGNKSQSKKVHNEAKHMSLPLGYFLVFQLNLGLDGVWIATAADEWVRAVIMYFRWKSRAWEKHGLIEHEAPEHNTTSATPAVAN